MLRRPLLSRAHLGATQGWRSSLRPDVPGYYVIRLHIGSGPSAGADVISVSATDPNPLLPLNTIRYSDSSPPVPGLQIGNHYYQSQYDAVQVYVLNRQNLGFEKYLGFQANSQAFDTLRSDLQQLSPNDLVVVTHGGTESQAVLPSDSLDSLDSALRVIGGTVGGQWQFADSACWSGGTNYCDMSTATWKRCCLYGGSFSVIGVPGLPPGQAWRETAAQNRTVDGRIVGYLTPNVETNSQLANGYTVVPGPDPYEPVTTCTSDSCAVQVGGQSYSVASGVTNGVHVVVLDRTTLTPIVNRTVTTVSDLTTAVLPAFAPPLQQTVLHYVWPCGNPTCWATDQTLVILQSIGDGHLTGTVSGPNLVQVIDELGGTAEAFLAGMTGGQRYALVGAPTNLPWRGTSAIESSTAMATSASGQNPTGTISGELQRDRSGLYTPLTGDPVGPTNNDLYGILYQPATTWPFVGDPALPYIANGIGLASYPDVRSAYPNLSINFTVERQDLSNLTCSDPTACGPNFTAVKDELYNEFGWVQAVRDFGDNLKKPYVEAGNTPYFNVEEITKAIQSTVPVRPNDDVVMQWLKIMTGFMTIAQKAATQLGQPEAATVFGVIAGAGSLATQVMQTNNAAPANQINSTAVNLADQMANQETSYLTWTDSMVDILTADYGKLSTIGPALKTPSWSIDGTTVKYSVAALNAGARASAYSALLPVAWHGYDLKPGFNQTDSNDVTTLVCDEPANYPSHRTPFASALPANQFHAATGFTSSGQRSEVWLFANTEPWTTGIDAWADMPTSSLTDNIYGPTSTGGAGAFQYGPAWWRSTYNPPGHATCGKGSGSLDVNQVWSQNYPPPNIAPPLP